MIVPRGAWIALGASAGILIVRRVQKTARAVTPAGLADRAGVRAQGLGEAASSFLDQVRRYAAEREAELREALGLDGSADLVDAPGRPLPISPLPVTPLSTSPLPVTPLPAPPDGPGR